MDENKKEGPVGSKLDMTGGSLNGVAAPANTTLTTVGSGNYGFYSGGSDQTWMTTSAVTATAPAYTGCGGNGLTVGNVSFGPSTYVTAAPNVTGVQYFVTSTADSTMKLATATPAKPTLNGAKYIQGSEYVRWVKSSYEFVSEFTVMFKKNAKHRVSNKLIKSVCPATGEIELLSGTKLPPTNFLMIPTCGYQRDAISFEAEADGYQYTTYCFSVDQQDGEFKIVKLTSLEDLYKLIEA